MTIKANVTGLGTPAQTASAIVGGVNSTVAAAGTTQATATLLPFSSNFVVSTGTGGVILPPGIGSTISLSAGDSMRVFNYSGGSINVYPPTGGKISNGSANAAFVITNTKGAEFVCIDGTSFAANLSA